MKSIRFTAFCCLFTWFCMNLVSVMAGGDIYFRCFRVQNSMDQNLTLEVEEKMFEGKCFCVDGDKVYTEKEWLKFFARNLLVGRNADKIKRIVLQTFNPQKCGGRERAYSGASLFACRFRVFKSDTRLIIVCPSIFYTVQGKWYLNEYGMRLFG